MFYCLGTLLSSVAPSQFSSSRATAQGMLSSIPLEAPLETHLETGFHGDPKSHEADNEDYLVQCGDTSLKKVVVMGCGQVNLGRAGCHLVVQDTIA